MKLNKLIPIIYTGNVQDTLDFYLGNLGFICTARTAEWASLSFDSVELMVSKPNDHFPFEGPNFTGSFYFNTNSVAEIWWRVKDKLRICYPIEDFVYGMREFAVFDNNGYLLQFGQSISMSFSPP